MSAPRPNAFRLAVFAVLTLSCAWLTARASRAQDLFSDDTLTTPGAQPAVEATTTTEQPQQQLTQEDVKKMFDDAQAALKAEDYQTALTNYDKLIQILKQQGLGAQAALPVVYTGRGQAFAGLDDPEAAVADFNAALQEDSTFLPALVARGKLYLDVGAIDAALQDFEAAKEQNRQDPEVLFGLGKAYVLLGRCAAGHQTADLRDRRR